MSRFSRANTCTGMVFNSFIVASEGGVKKAEILRRLFWYTTANLESNGELEDWVWAIPILEGTKKTSIVLMRSNFICHSQVGMEGLISQSIRFISPSGDSPRLARKRLALEGFVLPVGIVNSQETRTIQGQGSDLIIVSFNNTIRDPIQSTLSSELELGFNGGRSPVTVK